MKPLFALALLPVILGACALPPAPTNTATAAPAEDKGVEVTGSRLKRKDTQGVANMSREEFEAARQAAQKMSGQ